MTKPITKTISPVRLATARRLSANTRANIIVPAVVPARHGKVCNSPVATSTHAVFSTRRDLPWSQASSSGRTCDSITHMLRNTTVAVSAA